MAKYSFTNTQNASTTLDLLTMYEPGSAMRRFKLYDFSIGSAAAPGDTAILWTFFRTSAAPTTPVAVTGQPLDSADGTATTLGSSQPATNGTHGVTLYSVALNQRATYRWVAAPGGELVCPATANNGIALATPTSTTISVTGNVMIEEQ
jgi:hypothetical protein